MQIVVLNLQFCLQSKLKLFGNQQVSNLRRLQHNNDRVDLAGQNNTRRLWIISFGCKALKLTECVGVISCVYRGKLFFPSLV